MKKARKRLGINQVELAKRAGLSSGAIGNLEAGTRELPRNMLGLAQALQVRPEWLQFGTEPMEPEIGAGFPQQAQPVILDGFTVSPTISWEQLMGPLPTVFKVSAPDSSMAPRVAQGTLVEFTRDITPRPGDGVLVRDNMGNHFMRMYRERRPGHWEAYAINEAYRPLDSKDDNLTVVAVLTAVSARWS